MGLNTYHVDENGNAMCTSCRKKIFISEADQCILCERWVCHSCGTYLRQGYHGSYGYVCKACLMKIRREERANR